MGDIRILENAQDEQFLTCSQEITDLSKEGYQLLKENRVNEALECFKQILELDTDNNYALVGMGDSCRKRGAHRDAVRYYEQCLNHHPGNNYALFGLADCYKVLNQYPMAIKIWKEYLKHDSRNVTVLTRIADAYRKLRDFKNSKEEYERVLQMEDHNPYAIIGLGHLHYDFKEYRDALYFWEKMLETRNMACVDIRVLTSIGNCHRKLKTFDDGIAYFDAALQREPNNFYALFGLGDCFRGLNQPRRALEYWNRILQQDPRNKVILTRAGDAYCTLREFDNAKDYYNRALNIEFDIYGALGLATIDKLQGHIEQAINSLTKLLQHDPKNHRLYLELADCYIKIDDAHQAVEILRAFQRFGIRNNAVTDLLEKIGESRIAAL
ncbi:MAG: tetratricopeptide repeat protein [Spirochaetaceae bacterium]|nr:tetratricopeptide repeat protein [Spirochaetaceae bacterium]